MSSPYLDCPECEGVMFANAICAHCQIKAHSEHEMALAVAAEREACALKLENEASRPLHPAVSYSSHHTHDQGTLRRAAQLIRARGEK